MITGRPADIGNISRATGLSEEDVRFELQHATAAFHGKAMEAARSAGMHPNDYQAFRTFSEKHPEGKSALHALVFGSDVRQVQQMAKLFLSSQLPSAQSLADAGIRHWVQNGTEYIDHPTNGIVTLKQAIAAGWL